MTRRKRKQWSKVVEESGVRVRIYKRAGSKAIYREVRLPDGSKDRKSLKTNDRSEAEELAKALCRELAMARLSGRDLRSLTLGKLFAAYRQHRVPGLKPPRQREAEARITMFLEAWGADLPVGDVDATRVAAYCKARRRLEIVSPGLRPDPDGNRRRGYRKPKPIRDGALDAEFRWLNSVFNWARGYRVEGRPLLAENPLTGIDWPREKNPRRPVASPQRFLATLAHADEVDPKGRLRGILALARHTGRRESAICAIRASDLLLSEGRIRAALAAAGMDERMAEHMPHGAIRWAAESDKQGLLFISPINRDAREALELYLRRNPRMGDVPLFPASGPVRKKKGASSGPEKPMRRETAAKWLVKAEELAGLPKLVGGVFHPYRRLWATERKDLPLVDVAAAGGWKDTQALRLSYQHADAETVLRVVEGSSRGT